MADALTDGNTRVAWVGAVSNINNPTTTELNLGILLQSTLTSDGLMGFEASTGDVDNTSLASTFNTKVPGRADFSGTGLRLKKQNPTASDTIYNTLTFNTSGFIVIRRDSAQGTAWATGDKVEVYPVTCGQIKILPPEGGNNSVRKYEVPTLITSDPALRATVA